MSTTIINIKTQVEVKREIQRLARELGVSVSALVNSFLKRLIRTKKITLSLDEKPNKRLIAAMKKAQEDYSKGNTSPAFKTGKEAIAWLEKHGI